MVLTVLVRKVHQAVTHVLRAVKKVKSLQKSVAKYVSVAQTALAVRIANAKPFRNDEI